MDTGLDAARARGRPSRVLVASPDGPVGAGALTAIARALREVGDEVIATGSDQTPPMIVAAAVDEDVDCVVLYVAGVGNPPGTGDGSATSGAATAPAVIAVRAGLAAVGLLTPVVAIGPAGAAVDTTAPEVVARVGAAIDAAAR